jgi:molecular chaperone GrpE
LADDPPDDEEGPPEGGMDSALNAALTPPPSASSEAGEAVASPHEQRARLAEDRLAEVLAAYRKMKAENDDVRERQSRNLERRFDQRRERLLLKFIDVLDNLDRALEAAQTSYAGQPLLEGMILVRTQLLQTLQDEGLDRIPVLGLPFDPAVSEAVATEPVKEAEQDHVVVKELLRGYRLNGRIARPARVVIGMFQGAPAEAAPPPAPAGGPSETSAVPDPAVPAAPDLAAAPPPPAVPVEPPPPVPHRPPTGRRKAR